MLILDTNHYSMLEEGGTLCGRLRDRLERNGDWYAVTVITEEEVLKGRLAQINRPRQPDSGVDAYRFLQDSVAELGSWLVLPWTAEAVDVFGTLKHLQTKIGSMDLRITSIALSVEATLLTRNLRHFDLIPGLRAENWLD